jgi:hypothetical protein
VVKKFTELKSENNIPMVILSECINIGGCNKTIWVLGLSIDNIGTMMYVFTNFYKVT